MKTLIGVNTLDSVNSFVYSSHCALFSNMRKQFPDDEFIFFTPYRMPIDMMRNYAAKMAIDGEYDYLMFIDDDVAVSADTYKSLRAADKDVIMALTFVRGYPFNPMFFKSTGIVEEDGVRSDHLDFYLDWQDKVDDDGLVKCDAVGFSCALIKMDVVKALEPPYFVTSPRQTEDVYFCCKARYTLQPEPTFYVDTKIPTAHFMMPDAVSLDNVEAMRRYFAPDQPVGKSRFDRVCQVVKELKTEAKHVET